MNQIRGLSNHLYKDIEDSYKAKTGQNPTYFNTIYLLVLIENTLSNHMIYEFEKV
jgi:hypothetical protein